MVIIKVANQVREDYILHSIERNAGQMNPSPIKEWHYKIFAHRGSGFDRVMFEKGNTVKTLMQNFAILRNLGSFPSHPGSTLSRSLIICRISNFFNITVSIVRV